MPDFVDAAKRPFQGGAKTIFVSFIIGFLGALTFGIGNILLNGFVIEATKNQLHRRNELPDWSVKHALPFFIAGLKFSLVEFVYSIPGMLLLLIALGSLIFTTATNFVFAQGPIDTVAISATIISSAAMILAGGLLLLLGRAFSLMAIVNMADKDKLSAAFDIGPIVRKIFTPNYFLAFVLSTAYFFVLFFIFVLLSIFTVGILGFLLGGGIFFYLYNTTVFTLVSQAYLELN